MIIPAHKKFLSGFTLIELLIVIAILGILAAAVLVAVNPAKRQKQARDSARKNDIGQLATALQAYFTTPGQGLYPAGSGAPGSPGLGSLTTSGDLKQLPTDPTDGTANYTYTVAGNLSEAAIYDLLEDPTNTVAGTYVWCWRSATGKAAELAIASCVP